MRAEISSTGHLSLERRGIMRSAACPFATFPEYSPRPQCGDWCSHFGEPVKFPVNQSEYKWMLTLCHGRALNLIDVIDNRERDAFR